MKEDYWQSKWKSGEIAFHEVQPNPNLVIHISTLALTPGARVFVPLCGKTVDLDWLLQRGQRVVGIEFNAAAATEVFTRLGITPEVTITGALTHFAGPSIDVFVGDFFALTTDLLGQVDAIYDRAALVALPIDLRPRYAAHLAHLTSVAPMLLIAFDYDQSRMSGPPFSVPGAEIRTHYNHAYTVSQLSRKAITGRLQKRVDGLETVWHLMPN